MIESSISEGNVRSCAILIGIVHAKQKANELLVNSYFKRFYFKKLVVVFYRSRLKNSNLKKKIMIIFNHRIFHTENLYYKFDLK